MSRSITVNENGANFELYIPDGTSDYFADGFSQLLMGWPTSKVIFHNLTKPASPQDPQEHRECAFKLTVPTAVLLQLAQQVLGAMAQNNQQLLEAVNNYNEQFIKGLPTVA
ncbi:hypothetical protein WJ05_17785 [Burkholderia vietnamiensis]|uniref:hypothetical protein n=1 Tax=Burkholderia vietnamiensis TaxID=60552 RepID=UPI00075CBEA5|nr:hypothetical protein [Burkholderia vietnamiensis]KVF09674.1 hypothetical protein WJ05_17785 [Burkholderia vietnamiensis]HDR9126251.1 hypothetical protein [Burkholderia vietnamiensis]